MYIPFTTFTRYIFMAFIDIFAHKTQLLLLVDTLSVLVSILFLIFFPLQQSGLVHSLEFRQFCSFGFTLLHFHVHNHYMNCILYSYDNFLQHLSILNMNYKILLICMTCLSEHAYWVLKCLFYQYSWSRSGVGGEHRLCDVLCHRDWSFPLQLSSSTISDIIPSPISITLRYNVPFLLRYDITFHYVTFWYNTFPYFHYFTI